MSSALAAFAKSQSSAAAPAAAAPVDEIAEEQDGYTSDQDVQPATPSSLMDVAQQQKQQLRNRTEKPRKTVTLVDIARDQAPPLKPQQPTTLMDVARQQEAAQQREATSQQLHSLAAQVQAEAHAADDRRSREIQHALSTTSNQVQHEMQTKQQAIVRQALKHAVAEEQEEQATEGYNQEGDDAFEQEDPVVRRAVDRVVQATTQDNNDKRDKPIETLSVDRHILKQRQQRHGLAISRSTKSTPKPTVTMKQKISSFQFSQLTLTQQRVFLAMIVDDEHANKKAKKTVNMHAIEELAKDRATQLRDKQRLLKIKPLQYAKLDDNRHCRFKPKIKNASGCGSSSNNKDDDDDGDGGASNQRGEDFIRRMEATERVRNEQLRRTRAEREYLAQIDKKECPQCGNPQSYAELSQKRKKCPNCGVSYKSRLAWSEVADEFLARMQAHLTARLERANHRDSTSNSNNKNNAKGKIQKPNLKKWHDVRDEFLGRVQLDLMQREMTKELILQELEAQCTFAPVISERARRLQLNGDFDERLRRDLENRRIRQDQYKLLAAAIAKAEATTGPVKNSNTSRNTTSGSSTGRRNKTQPFEQRLAQDLQKRRERLAQNDNPKVAAISTTTSRSRGLY